MFVFGPATRVVSGRQEVEENLDIDVNVRPGQVLLSLQNPKDIVATLRSWRSGGMSYPISQKNRRQIVERSFCLPA
jgi:hypothetical protein